MASTKMFKEGQVVTYRSYGGETVEVGIVRRINEKYVFVEYPRSSNPIATNPDTLTINK